MIYLETNSTDPAYNLAFEQYLLEHRLSGDYLLLWQNDKTVVVGQNQNVFEEIDPDYAKAHGIRVVRRMTGGGAVYHDRGNLNYSFITDHREEDEYEAERFTIPVVRALRELGLNAESSGRNDILINGKKVSGTAERIFQDRVLHHGTLLFDSDPAVIGAVLRPDPEKFSSKSIKSVRSRVGSIKEELEKAGISLTLEEFWAKLLEAFRNEIPQLSCGSAASSFLKPEELAAIEALKTEKYESYEWTYGRSPKYSFRNRKRFPGGSVEIRADVSDGLIQELRFFGDFLGQASVQPLEQALAGTRFEENAVSEVLSRFPLSQLFGTISKEELLSVFCSHN